MQRQFSKSNFLQVREKELNTKNVKVRLRKAGILYVFALRYGNSIACDEQAARYIRRLCPGRANYYVVTKDK